MHVQYRRTTYRVVLLAISAFWILHAAAVRAQTYPFQKYTTAEGLSHPAVRKVFQDSRGMLWFGTEGGVTSYDGRTFVEWLASNSDPCPVYDIFEDRTGTLWLGTYGFGLMRLSHNGLNRQTRPSIDSLLRNYVTAITEDAHGTVWVGSDDGLFAFRKNGGGERILGLDGVGEIYALVVDTSGTLWVGTHNGLFAGHPKLHDSVTFRKILQRPTRSLLLRRNGDVLAGTSGGGNDQDGVVCRVNGGRADTLLSFQTAKSLIKAQSLCEDAEGKLWIGTGYGIFILTEQEMIHIRSENGLPNETVYDIMQDREGTMWFGTENGVVKLGRPVIVDYGMKVGLTGYVSLCAMKDRHGNLWFGMWNGLNRIDRRGSVTCWDQTNGLPHHTVRSLAETPDGRILAGTLRGPAIVTGNHAEPLIVHGLPREMDVWSIYCESDNTIWFGGGGRLYRTRNSLVEREMNLGDTLPGGAVQVQGRDSRGRLWYIAGGRAEYLDAHGDVRPGPISESQAHRPVNAVCQDNRGNLWFCTRNGVELFDVESLLQPNGFVPPRIEGRVYWMIESKGINWFGTDHGVFSWDGQRIHHLNTADGLASDIVSMACTARDGALWLCTHGGISVLNPSNLAYVAPVPEVYLDPVLGRDGTRPVAEPGMIPYEDRTVVFRFNALSFVGEREMLFQWKVEGLDEDWQDARKERQVRYTNLGAGRYNFKVRAANRNGQWSEAVTYPFEIQPPFWQRWWFVAFSIALVGTVLAIAYRFRVNQLLKVERMRRQIAADLHDDIASSLSSVGIYAAVVQQQIQDVPEEVRGLLDRIRELTGETMENIGLIVWSVDPRQDKLTQVFRYFQRHAEHLCKAASVDFLSRVPEVETAVLLTPEQRRTLFLILKEALNNSLRHSGCSRVQFACSLVGRELELALRDDGRGFRIPSDGGHGLQNMRSRSESIGARLEVTSAPGEGTTVSLKLRIA